MKGSEADMAGGLPRTRAVTFIILLGAISLFADMTYEGARSITGPYLGALGVTATTIGIVAGLGELVGYAVRLGSGYLADASGRYWAVTIFGYVLNLFAVPLLALAGNWQVAVVLIIAERMGRAVRSPPRDAMLSHAAGQTGLGWGFGLHQALDQTGAVVGPLIVSGVLFLGNDYRMDPDALCDRDGGRRRRRPSAGIAVRPDRAVRDDPRDGNLGSRRAAGFSRGLCPGRPRHGVLGNRHRRSGIGHARDHRTAGTARAARDRFRHFQCGLWRCLVCRQRPARRPLRSLDR